MDEASYRRFGLNLKFKNKIFKPQAFIIDVFFCLKRGRLNVYYG